AGGVHARRRLVPAGVYSCRVGQLALVAGLGGLAVAARDAGEDVKHYVCPPCGAPCDAIVFDKPGACPQCGMALVEQGSIPIEPPHKKVAILIFNGVEIIDYTGPWEMF